MPNKLAGQPSSYLKAASSQPIDWHPWSEEAFEKAKKEGKPVLLSIGAVWCHWCHVQAHQSWEDKETADIVNKNFVAVKVDRDERPDIDSAYQKFVQMFTGNGGWPLTVFLTSGKKPFFGGTYFEREDLKAILKGISETYKDEKERIDKMTQDVASLIETGKRDLISLDGKTVERGIAIILGEADSFNGGFGSMPKFPMPEVLLLLWDYYYKTGRGEIRKFLDLTLRKMAEGGMYDHLAGGFHRYSTDEGWRVPHFEKMLNDNALLLKVYLKAYQVTGEEFYRRISEEIIGFLVRDMYDSKTGLFYSSQDAGDESYFTWAKKGVIEILGEKDGKVFCFYYGIKDGETQNLYKAVDLQDIVDELGLKKEEIEKILERSRKILFSFRNKREPSFIDKNTFTNWNCLAVSAFFDAYKILGEKKYFDIAIKNLDFVLGNLYKEPSVYHMWSSSPGVDGFLDDYIFFAKALTEAYQMTFDDKYLQKSEEILKLTVGKFWDKKDNGFFYSQDRYLSSEKPVYDYSSLSGNSLSVSLFLDLFYLTEKQEYMEHAKKILELFHTLSPRDSLQKGAYLQALDYFFAGAKEFVIVGNKEEKIVKEFIEIIGKKFGNKIILVGEGDSGGGKFKGKVKVGGKPTIYICYKNTCSKPITDKMELEAI